MSFLASLVLAFSVSVWSLDAGAASLWQDASHRAREFVAQLTTTEKIGIVSGGYSQPSLPCVGSIGAIERLNFSGLCFSDGPAGVSRSDGVSVFASGLTAAASWDRKLIYERAVALGEEFRAKGAHVHLGPSTGPMGRHALGGRNWESFGPDPYLAGVAMNASVSGVQSVGVQACAKHFIGNEQETQRTLTTSDNGTVVAAVSANVDDRTLHELYLWPFANAVKAGTSCVMCSYNRVNGRYSCANPDTLALLKDELGFPGYVVSDWYATHGTASYANAGLDLEMPGNVSAVAGSAFFGELLRESVKNGTVQIDRLSAMAERVMRPYFLLNQDQQYPTVDPASGASFLVYQYGHNSGLGFEYPMVDARNVRDNHYSTIREMGASATVLLKNTNHMLPLKNYTNVGIFGNDSPYPSTGSVFLGYGQQPDGFEFGTVDIGGGSGAVRHTHLVTPLDAVQRHVGSYGGRVQNLIDNNEVADGRFRTIYPIPDVCILFLKAYASEGQDRRSLDLEWNATTAVESTAALCNNTVVVVHGPGIVLMPWADHENVTAIVSAQYPGEETGNCIADVLWGFQEPSGRLPYTIPRSLSDYGPPITNFTGPVLDPNAWQSDFEEGQLIDYRHFDNSNIEPLYEFGFGLSYAEFEIADHIAIEIQPSLPATVHDSQGAEIGGLKALWDPVANVTAVLSNIGKKSGAEVVQLYLYFPQEHTPHGTPLKVLRGFEKVYLNPGEATQVSFPLLRRDVSFWDSTHQRWEIPRGEFTIAVGRSSRDLKIKATSSVLY